MDERGVPLSIVVTGANEHDVTKLSELLDARVIKSPDEQKENLCLDAGYVGKPTIVATTSRGFIPHIRPRGEEKKEIKQNPDFKPRRWIVEVAHSWFNRFRKLLVRYEKTLMSSLALHYLAAATICFRKAHIK